MAEPDTHHVHRPRDSRDSRDACRAIRAIRATREAYDAAAPTYAELFRDTLRDSPLDRAFLNAFAEAVGAQGEGRVADVGCGPGHVTSYLSELGLAAFGVDASPVMIGLARQAYPDLRFDVGSMAALNIADGALGGVLSRWSIIHTPPHELPAVVREFHRVLAPGGHLLIGFSAGDDPAGPPQVFDHAVAPAYRWSPDQLAAMLREAGLAEVARMVRAPQPTDRRQFQEIHLLARKAQQGAARPGA
ncbi:class I SAM-dependent methyltransferase [Streptomyces sp. SID10853]|uniref:class I SAM-dependent methyltransferase n=1 Tax=Streptomyces sp. SID10853 TaxID=2706028 RepID=UPI0013C1E433|nr:class I SAM-dependent methyltransferase [Streptomyces sp. SID10853]NDZ77806.1 class I SAM-dependent methyltransferase [Streptomyces sp. SID10853]